MLKMNLANQWVKFCCLCWPKLAHRDSQKVRLHTGFGSKMHTRQFRLNGFRVLDGLNYVLYNQSSTEDFDLMKKEL